MAKRKQFTFYESFYRALVKLPIEEAQQGLWAIVTYGLMGTLPDAQIAPAADAVLEMAIPVLDTARNKAEAISASNKRRAKKNQSDSNVIPMGVQSVSNIAQEKENEIENEIEKENENEVEKEVEVEEEIEKESYLYISSLSGETAGDDFERFWDLYPIKLGKQKAWEAWQADPPDMYQMETAIRCWKSSRQWRQENGRFIPRAEKFLKEKHYLVLPKQEVPTGASGYLGKAELEAIERLMNESDV